MSQNKSIESPWFGNEHPLRGLNHIALGNKFIDAYPLGSVLHVDDLDTFFAKEIPGYDVPSERGQNREWKGFLHERHEAKERLNSAGMTKKVKTSFVIVHVSRNHYEVRKPEAAYASNTLPGRMQSLIRRKDKLAKWIGQAIPHWLLDKSEIDGISRMKRVLDGFVRQTNLSVELLEDEFAALRTTLIKHFETLEKQGEEIPREFQDDILELKAEDESFD